VNQEESEQSEVDGTKKGADDSTGKVTHMSGWLVNSNDNEIV